MFLGIGTIEFIEDVGKCSFGFLNIHQSVTDLIQIDLPSVEFTAGIEFIEDLSHYLLPVPIVMDMKSLDSEREAIGFRWYRKVGITGQDRPQQSVARASGTDYEERCATEVCRVIGDRITAVERALKRRNSVVDLMDKQWTSHFYPRTALYLSITVFADSIGLWYFWTKSWPDLPLSARIWRSL